MCNKVIDSASVVKYQAAFVDNKSLSAIAPVESVDIVVR